MKKKILFMLLTVVLVLVSCQKVDYEQLKADFDNLLSTGSYDSANALFTAAEDERIDYYKQSLDAYSSNLINNAQSNMSLEDGKKALTDFLVFEYTKPQVQQAIDNIVAQEEAIAASAQSYLEGLAHYNAREYAEALEKLSLVADFDENYQGAQDTLALINARASVWNNASANNEAGRNPYVNSVAYKDGYMYFPVDINDVHSIVKHNYATGDTQIFPLVEFVGTFHITGINVIGDYIYFAAGEELGTGIMLDNPYNIYEMKTDGTELTMVKQGDYYDLIFKSDTFYALSYSKGLVKMDKDFRNEEVISDKWIIEMQITDNGLYYTEKLDNTYNTYHILHLYKDGQSTEVLKKRMLHAYFFDTFSILANDWSTQAYEEVFIADMNAQNEVRVALLKDAVNGDFNGFIGAVGDTIMLNTAGWMRTSNSGAAMRQNIYTEIQVSKKRLDAYQSVYKVPEYEVVNMLYEENMQLIKSIDGTYSLAERANKNDMTHPINIPEYDSAALESNAAVIDGNSPKDDAFYSEEEVVFESDDFWYYSSPTLNVTIERIYDEYIETLIYVTHVRTNDPNEFHLGYSDGKVAAEAPGIYTIGVKTDDIATMNKAVFATNGDFAMFAPNTWSGKVIRDGKIFDGTEFGLRTFEPADVYDTISNCKDYLAYYPDGTMKVYSYYDNVTYGELMDAGVQNTLSFGPILVRDSEKTNACTDPGYYISGANPRCAWGMVEPGHYVNIVADGRQPGISRGMSFYTMSEYFQDLGCSLAYNFDGGQTAAISFMGKFLNTHQNDAMYTNHRPVQEIIYFGTSDLVPYKLKSYYEE